LLVLLGGATIVVVSRLRVNFRRVQDIFISVLDSGTHLSATCSPVLRLLGPSLWSQNVQGLTLTSCSHLVPEVKHWSFTFTKRTEAQRTVTPIYYHFLW